MKRLDACVGDNLHRGLLFVKLLYGTRVLSLVYMSVRAVPRRAFVLVVAGYAARKGWTWARRARA